MLRLTRPGIVPARAIPAIAILLLCAFCATSMTGCRKPRKSAAAAVAEDTAGILSMIHAADPRSSVQMLRGFHELENNSWRWTAGEFAVTLQPPAGSPQKGARLLMKLTVPPISIEKFQSITLTPTLNELALPPETYSKSGDYTLTRDIPSTALSGDPVTVVFRMDKFIPASESDQRDLGLIMSLIGLETK